MSLSVHFLLIIFCTSGHIFVRANSPKKFATHRYHPTTFYSGQKDEPNTAADDIQYAYEGGESHAGEVTSHQDNDYQESSYQPEVQHDIHPDVQHDIHTDVQHDIHPDVQHDTQPDVQHDIHPVLYNNIHPVVHQEFYPEVHDYQHEVQHDYKAVDGHLDSDYQGTSYGNVQDYSFHYSPEHDYHDLSPGYHYLTPPTALPHPMVETPKQTPPQQTYYYLGRHLWYIPLYFSIYFIIYVGALVLKSVARHKILFPYNLEMAAAHARTAKSLEEASKKFYM